MRVERLIALSDRLMRVERVICGLLAALITGLILLNVGTRALNVALFWVDELAVYAMIWMALIGASVLIRQRRHVAVSIGHGASSIAVARTLNLTVDLLVLLFAAGLVLMCLAWFDPIGIFRYDFDYREFAASTYNFIYQEPTNTLGIQKFWVWLIVPVVATAMTVHALANLVESFSSRGDGPC